MSERDEQIGERIALLRAAGNIRQTDIAALLAVDPSTVSKIESGRRRLDGYELALIAELLGTTSRELLGLPTRTAALAAAARAAGSSPDPALRRARELLEVDGIADQIGVAEPARPRRLHELERPTNVAIDDLAREARQHLGVGPLGGIADLIGAVEHAFGLDVAIDSFGDSGPAGVLVQAGDEVALTVLNGDDRRTRQRFTLAHELGHWLLGDARPIIVDDPANPADQTERRANRFASELLMPAAALGDLFGNRPAIETFVGALVEYGVSKEALLIRVTELDLIDDAAGSIIGSSLVRQLFARAGRSSDLDAWEVGLSARVPARIERRLRVAYGDGKVGIGLMAQAFGVDVETLGARFDAEGLRQPHVEIDDDTLAAL
ncbi:MAG TPA: XRE family transcriptional regulator [Ilumatobacter sp.]|nr:XRE family transcriptional regulator [Ilumatobacter sp.]